MAKKKKEEAVVETVEQPKVDNKVEKIKVKMKKLQSSDQAEIPKIDLTKPPKTEKTDAVQEPGTSDSDVKVEESKDSGSSEKVVEEVRSTTEEKIVPNEETPVVEEITNEEVVETVEEVTNEVEKEITKSMETGKPLPENIQKVVNFIDDTGGDLEDYMRLNKDYDKMDQSNLLQEYYKQTKPHLTGEEVNFLIEDKFSYEEDVDEEKDIKRKKLALKEQVADAKAHLDRQKSKYYAEIKAGSKLTSEQQEAVNFYDKHKKETATTEEYNAKAKNVFLNRTNKFFGDKFKGFEYNVGDKRFRFNVKDANQLKDTQSDINNFIGKFLDKNNLMQDEAGYHKSLFTAMNPDTVANHFYEQGKADALKDSMARSKNVDMSPRQQFGEVKDNSGMKFRVVKEDQSPVFKFKTKQ